ncbi:Hypothetical protein DHA2_152764 [Giardia duodenalis]|uniref:Uncharacterized protein n=1 Tax=Giardia intestinalis TaxID=5741 RepID=V6TGJ9_GIAIN|nr:Hypothetical protein DHA2_152764 [Giardia intestinalis]
MPSPSGPHLLPSGHKSQLVQLADELELANEHLLLGIFAINKDTNADLQRVVMEAVHLSTGIANIGDSVTLAALRGREHHANIYNVKTKQQANTTESEKQQMIRILEAVDHILTVADNLLKDLQAYRHGADRQFELSIIEASQSYFEAMYSYAEEFPGFDTFVVVSRSHAQIKDAIRTFVQALTMRLIKAICNEFAVIIATRKRCKVKDIKSYFDIASFREMLFSDAASISFLKELDPASYSLVRAAVVLVLYELARGSISFLEDNMHEGIAAPDINLLRGLGLKIYELSYSTICYPDSVPIDRRVAAEREAQTKSGRHSNSTVNMVQLHHSTYANNLLKDGCEYLDRALGYYFLAVTIYIYHTRDILLSVFFSSNPKENSEPRHGTKEIHEIERFTVVLDAVLNEQLSSRESLEVAIQKLSANGSNKLLTDLSTIDACLGTIFYPVLDYKMLHAEIKYFSTLDFTRSQSYRNTLKWVKDVPEAYFSSVRTRPLSHVLEGVLTSNPLYGFALYMQIDHALSIACTLDCDLMILLLSSALQTIESHVVSFTDTFHAHLSKQQPTIKQAGVFPGTIYTCTLLSAIHAMYCSATLTVKTLSASSPAYSSLFSSLSAFLPSDRAGSITFTQPDIEESTFPMTFKLDSGHMSLLKLITNPYMLIVERFEAWLDSIIVADKANTEKYRNIATIENLSFLIYFCDSLLEHNFSTSIQMSLKTKIDILLSEYIEENIRYKFCDNSSKDISWVQVVDKIEEVIAGGIQPTDVPTQTGLAHKDVEKAIKTCNSTIKKHFSDTMDRFFKHINLKAAIANCSSIVAVARIKDGTIGLLKQVSDALFESIKRRYSLFLDYSERCYVPSLRSKFSLSLEDLRKYYEGEFEKLKKTLPN